MKIFKLIALGIIGISTLTAQNVDINQYNLFEKFEEGLVYYRDGRQFSVPLNYNIVNRQFLFIDKNDNNAIKAFAEPDLVTLVKVGERLFLHDKKEIKEVVQIEPPITVLYKPKIKEKGKRAGYGGYSETSAIENISGIQSGGIYYKFEGENNIILSRVEKIYHIVHDKKKQKFFNEKTFLKIYSKQKDPLKQYIDKNKINFNSIDQVIQLCNYAAELK